MVDSTPSASGVIPRHDPGGSPIHPVRGSRPPKPTSPTTSGCSLKFSPPCRGSATAWKGAELGRRPIVRMDGLERMYGGEARLVNALLNAPSPHDLAPRAGVAEAKFSAFVAARISEPSRATRVPADSASFLAPHPVDLLPVPADLRAALR